MYIVRCINVRVMKDNKTKARFIELRGQGLPLKSIADELGVSKTTLVNWEQDLKEQVDNVRAMELEVLYDRYYLSVARRSSSLATC
jgi:transcriptional regulator with XRE-family HTH domain